MDGLIAYLRAQLNWSIRLPQMYGARCLAIWLYLDVLDENAALAGAERYSSTAWLAERGALDSSGIHSVLAQTFGTGDLDGFAAAIYAEYAAFRGFLDADRVLRPTEYADLRNSLREGLADCTISEIQNRFGPASVTCGGPNRRALVYLAHEEPVIQFFAESSPEGPVNDGSVDSRPILGVRVAVGSPFEIQLTPLGRRHRATVFGGEDSEW